MHLSSVVLFTLGLVVATPAVLADEVMLSSGERLVGRIIDKSTQQIMLETDDGAVVVLQWNDIESIATDAPLDAILTQRDRPPLPLTMTLRDGEGASRVSPLHDNVRL